MSCSRAGTRTNAANEDQPHEDADDADEWVRDPSSRAENEENHHLHGRRKRGYAGDVTPNYLCGGDIDMYIP